MGDFPTEEDEFDLMYADDLEALREQEAEFELEYNISKINTTQKTTQLTASSQPTTGTTVNALYPNTPDENDVSGDITASPVLGRRQNTPRRTLEELSDFDLNIPDETPNRKRTVDDLFGDINDLLDDNPAELKKKKLDEDLALIDQIIELRRLDKLRDRVQKTTRTFVVSDDKDNLSYTVPKYLCVTVKKHDDTRLYIRSHGDLYEKDYTENLLRTLKFSDVLDKTIWEKAQAIIEKQLLSQHSTVVATATEEKQLLVDRYKPRSYVELLSDESTNRDLLTWMKHWDKIVFKRRIKLKNHELDEDGRPKFKVVLLCGPPGLGKTTLAHCVAKHCGYNAIEVNASDDRSVEKFRSCLETATQMKSVLDRDHRPNCIVFDEIDGAPQAAVDFLVNSLTGTVKGKKGRGSAIIKRPVICICNDPYVPALRSLKKIALVINFPQISSKRLAERLVDIARWQKIKTDLGAMLALAEKSGNDIRSCLALLQLFKSNNKPVTLSTIQGASLGQKDTQKGLFTIWNGIFMIERSEKLRRYLDLKERSDAILDMVNSYGDYEKLSQGVWENYQQVLMKTGDLDRVVDALDWFCCYDLWQKNIMERQNFTLLNYVQYGFVAWNFQFATRQRPNLQYPSVGFEVWTRKNRMKLNTEEMLRGMSPKIRTYVQTQTLIMDILPLLMHIIVPKLRPINLHLYTKEERDGLSNVVDVMVDYNLHYLQERNSDGTYDYKLDPNFEQVVAFMPKLALSYSNRQLIANQIESKKIRTVPGPQEDIKQRLAVNFVKTTPKNKAAPRKDFFGRIVKTPESSKDNETGKSSPSNDIWFRYKEGYSNAVRKPLKMSSLK